MAAAREWRIKLEPRYVEAEGPILSFKVPLVKIGVADWTLLHLHSHFLSNGMYLSYSLMTKTLLITKLQIDFLSTKEWSYFMSIISKQPWDIQLQTNGPFVKFKPGVCESIGNIHILTKLNYIYRSTDVCRSVTFLKCNLTEDENAAF